jgi:hypothetical protein
LDLCGTIDSDPTGRDPLKKADAIDTRLTALQRAITDADDKLMRL